MKETFKRHETVFERNYFSCVMTTSEHVRFILTTADGQTVVTRVIGRS